MISLVIILTFSSNREVVVLLQEYFILKSA